jgi:hypothetical protein
MLNLIKKILGTEGKDAPLNDLERLFLRAMADPGARSAFYRSFLSSDLFVSGRMLAPGQAELQYYDWSGEKILPVFSHEQRLKEVLGQEAPLLHFKGEDLFRSVAPAQAIALNPYSRFGREFSATELKEVLEAC